MKRFRRYSYGKWCPRWWWYIVPRVYLCGSEYGQHTVVIHIPPMGFIVWAFWTCKCRFCSEIREATLKGEKANV